VIFVRRLAFVISLLFAPLPASGQQPSKARAAGQAPLTLDAAVTEALEHNVSLIATRAGVSLAEANMITARCRAMPESVRAAHARTLRKRRGLT
jgi:hypothetical protein